MGVGDGRLGSGMSAVDSPRLAEWLAGHCEGAVAPFEFELIEGGHSNLTYFVSDRDSRRWVLRRPPLGELRPSAHDVIREQRIMTAIARTVVPVPRVVAVCEDLGVLGVPFYVMTVVEGIVLRDEASARAAMDVAARQRAAETLVDGLITLHSLDPAAIGLEGLARGEGHVERQLRRWNSQLTESSGHRSVELRRAHGALAERVPDQGPARLVHGDYKLENCMFGPDGDLRAVLDWELCTLGDPLVDLGMLLVYWPDRTDGRPPMEDVAAVAPGFPGPGWVVNRYLAGVGRADNSVIDFYRAFALWRLACISEGVWSRYAAGDMGDRGETTSFRHTAERLTSATTKALAVLTR